MKYKLLISIILIAVITACGVPLRSVIPAAVSVPVPSGKVAQYMTVCDSGGLNVRDCAGIECKVIGGLMDGDSVEVFGHMTDSYGKMWSLTDSGWVNEKYLCGRN
jgi:hypothetical protein